MKRFTRFFAVVALVSAVAACGGESAPAETVKPGEVAVQLFNAITSGDVQVVKDNIHFDSQIEKEVFDEYLDMAVASQDYKERTAGYTANYEIVSDTITADTAFVKLKGMTALGKMTTFNVRLVRIDGDWKVDGSQAVLHREK